MNEKVIACIPSKTMREFLTVNPVEMSALQQATILCLSVVPVLRSLRIACII